jgi:hypothetical protein
VPNTPFAVGDIPIERIGRLSHTVQEVVHIVGSNTESEVLRHLDRHLIIREIITKKLVEVVDVRPKSRSVASEKLRYSFEVAQLVPGPVDFLCERQ